MTCIACCVAVGTQSLPVGVAISVAMLSLALVSMALLIFCKWRLYRKANMQQKVANNFMDVRTVLTLTSTKNYSQEWEIPKQNVNLVSLIGLYTYLYRLNLFSQVKWIVCCGVGEGFFGLVWQAEVSGIASPSRKFTAAVKMVKGKCGICRVLSLLEFWQTVWRLSTVFVIANLPFSSFRDKDIL